MQPSRKRTDDSTLGERLWRKFGFCFAVWLVSRHFRYIYIDWLVFAVLTLCWLWGLCSAGDTACFWRVSHKAIREPRRAATCDTTKGLGVKYVLKLDIKSVLVAQWENECISLSVLPMARVQHPGLAKYFKGFVPGWSRMLGKEMDIARMPQTHWKDMRNKKQHRKIPIQILLAAVLSSICICSCSYLTSLPDLRLDLRLAPILYSTRLHKALSQLS